MQKEGDYLDKPLSARERRIPNKAQTGKFLPLHRCGHFHTPQHSGISL